LEPGSLLPYALRVPKLAESGRTKNSDIEFLDGKYVHDNAVKTSPDLLSLSPWSTPPSDASGFTEILQQPIDRYARLAHLLRTSAGEA
jgi:hypothetical protein